MHTLDIRRPASLERLAPWRDITVDSAALLLHIAQTMPADIADAIDLHQVDQSTLDQIARYIEAEPDFIDVLLKHASAINQAEQKREAILQVYYDYVLR